MARYREAPKCPFCGKVIAKAKYRNQSDLPASMRLIGDTFEGWEYEEHECKEGQDFRDKLPKIKLE
jgi:hypothetical protein